MILNHWVVSRETKKGVRITGNCADISSARMLNRLWPLLIHDRHYENRRETVDSLLCRVGLNLAKVRPIGRTLEK